MVLSDTEGEEHDEDCRIAGEALREGNQKSALFARLSLGRLSLIARLESTRGKRLTVTVQSFKIKFKVFHNCYVCFYVVFLFVVIVLIVLFLGRSRNMIP